MPDLVRDAIAAELALVTRVSPTRTPPLGYGTDLSCGTDLTPTMDVVDPFSPRAIAEALVRRFDTPRGALPDDRDYGLDLKAYVNRGTTDVEVRELGEAVRTEAVKDDRVARARVTIAPTPAGERLAVRLHITPRDPRRSEPFSLVLAVTDVAVLLEELRRA